MPTNDDAGQSPNMVLRTVYLPKDVDDELKQLAFDRQTSKNDLIRSAVTDWIREDRRDDRADDRMR